MEIAVPVEMEEFFVRARMATEACDWVNVDCAEARKMDLTLDRLELSKEVSLLRAQYEVDIPIKDATLIGQPEVFFHPERPPNDHQIGHGVENLFAPGDAEVWVKVQFVPVLMRVASLIGSPGLGLFSTTTVHMRHMIHRDFPKPGSVTLVVAPLHPETREVLSEWGVVKSAVAVMEPHDDPCKTKVTEVKQLTRVPRWALPRAALMSFKHQFGSIDDYQNSFGFKQATEGAGRYIVVGIRRCSKGPPLLPRRRCDASDITISTEWMEAEKGGVRFGLPEYLRTFLKRLGVTDIPIYNRLHGRQIVRYQAVVQAQDWERAWSILETPFRTQRAAYRHTYGGSNAPDITMDMEPKFVAPDDSFTRALSDDSNEADKKEKSDSTGSDALAASQVPTARTFIHFSECRTRQRLGSDPADTLSPALMAC